MSQEFDEKVVLEYLKNQGMQPKCDSCFCDGAKWQFDQLKSQLEEKDARIAELEKLTYIAGHLECPKCKFHLVKNYLDASSGNISANNSPETCHNGCGPMWKVTYRENYKELYESFDKKFTEAESLKQQLESARVIISKINSESYLEPHLAAYELNVEAARWLEGNK